MGKGPTIRVCEKQRSQAKSGRKAKQGQSNAKKKEPAKQLRDMQAHPAGRTHPLQENREAYSQARTGRIKVRVVPSCGKDAPTKARIAGSARTSTCY